MELTELKSAWQQLERHVADNQALNQRLLQLQAGRSIHQTLRPLFWGMVATFLFGLGSVVAATQFWLHQLDQPAMMINGIVVHAYGVVVMILSGQTLYGIQRLDFGQPVLTIQRQLLELRHDYLRNGWIIGLPWWLLWLPYSVVAAGFQGTPWFADAVPTWYWVSLVTCSVGMVATWLVFRRLLDPRNPQQSEKTIDFLVGISLTRAKHAIDDVVAFTDTPAD